MTLLIQLPDIVLKMYALSIWSRNEHPVEIIGSLQHIDNISVTVSVLSFPNPVLIYFKQQTLTLKEPAHSRTLTTVFEKQLEKIEVLKKEILKIQQFMDVRPNNLLSI